jgi:HSP20 family molecular chaperone IbpA
VFRGVCSEAVQICRLHLRAQAGQHFKGNSILESLRKKQEGAHDSDRICRSHRSLSKAKDLFLFSWKHHGVVGSFLQREKETHKTICLLKFFHIRFFEVQTTTKSTNMESLPNSSFFQQDPPVVFFAAGPPTGPRSRTFGNNDHRNSNGNKFPWSFLAKLALIILSLYTIAMVVRIMLFLVAVVFSPPVLLLCLFILVMSGSHGLPFSSNDWNTTREFQRYFHNPPRLNRFFASNSWWTPAGCNPTRRSATRRAPTSNVSRTASTSRPATTPNTNHEASHTNTNTNTNPNTNTRPASPNQDFELVSPFHLMMAAAAAPNATDNNPTATEESSNDENDRNRASPYQKVPVHRQENENELVISMDVSGFDPSQLCITVENDNNETTLCIRGERVNKIGDRFEVDESFALDPKEFELESVSAAVSEGVLQVKVEKKAPPQPRIISIKANEKND